MHQVVQNMILTRDLEVELSLLWRTTISGQHPLFYRWEKVGEPLLPLYFDGSRGTPAFSHLSNKECWPEIVVLYNRLSLSSKPHVSTIFLIIWCILLSQQSILHDLFTVGFNVKTQVWKPSATTVCTCTWKSDYKYLGAVIRSKLPLITC